MDGVGTHHTVLGDFDPTEPGFDPTDPSFPGTALGEMFEPVNDSYETVIPGGTPARCNPITGPTGCQSTDVENLPAPDQPDATVPDPTTTSTSAAESTPALPTAARPQFAE